MLDAQAARDNGGRFRLETSGQFMHVIPTMSKNSEGSLVPQESVLDAIISLPAEERTGWEKLESICAAISRATNVPVGIGTIPTNWFFRYTDRQGAAREKARDVLVDMFETMTRDSETKLSWRLLCDPGWKRCALNIHMVSKRSG